ncbi:MAG: YcxB family protein [Bryobacteraceae bacterium]|nr:YcxB family protein [Bryobacteraceae bacterium]
MHPASSVSFQGKLVAEDLATGIRQATRRSWLHRLLIGWFVFLAIAFAAVALISQQASSWVGLIVPILFLFWLLGGASIQARSQFKHHQHLSELGTYEFDTAGFQISRPSLELKLPWSAVLRIVEFKDQYLIYSSPNCFHVVPRRFLADEQKWRELVSLSSGKPIEKG